MSWMSTALETTKRYGRSAINGVMALTGGNQPPPHALGEPEVNVENEDAPLNNDSNMSKVWWDYSKKYGPYAAAAIAVPVTVPVVLSGVGFTSGGIVAGSVAAKMMSAAAVANGGGVAAGGAVAVCQSVAAAGIGTTANFAVGAVGAGAVAAFNKLSGKGKDKENDEDKVPVAHGGDIQSRL